jgi:hypothetical protein
MLINVKNKKGSAIAYAIAVVFAVSIITISIVLFTTNQIKNANHTQDSDEAFQIAEAGVDWYNWYLAHQTAGKTASQVTSFWQSTNPYPAGINTAYSAEYDDSQGGALGKYSITVTPPSAGSTIVTATVTGWTYAYPGAKRKIQVRFRRPSWSEFAMLGNAFQRFGNGTTISGPLFVNGGIQFDGVAKNTIYSSVATYFDSDSDVNATKPGVWTSWSGGYNTSMGSNVFLAGTSFPVATQDFAGLVSDLSDMRSQAGIKYDNTGGGRYITLKTDGTFNMCKVNSYSSTTNDITNYSGVVSGATSGNGNSCTTTSCCAGAACPWISSSHHNQGVCSSMTNVPIPSNGLIFVANNAWVDGSINNKKVTIVAAELTDESNYTGGNKNIFLGTGNLLYTNTDGSDIIGLIAQNNVEVFQDSLSSLTIDGALMAVGGRVGRNNYGNTKTTITVDGAIASNQRYGFAYTDGTGYTTRNLIYDNNLLYYPPPYFPTGTQYSIDLWQEL